MRFTLQPPPFLIGSVLLFWGWQSQMWLFAIPMAVILEAARWVNWRWSLSDKDFNRIADLTTLSWILTAVYLFNQESVRGLFTLLNWLPLIFFMLIFAQMYSTIGTLRLSSIFVSLRQLEGKNGVPLSHRVNMLYPYLLMALLATSAVKHPAFFFGTAILLAWAMLPLRSPRYSLTTWSVVLLLTSSMAYAAQIGLHQLQNQIEQVMLTWLEQYLWANRDPYKQRTAIGDIGKLKMSEQILLRVKLDQRRQPPLYLRQTSYTFYADNTWHARAGKFDNITPEFGVQSRWSLQPLTDLPLYQVTIDGYLANGRGVLALPLGTQRIEQLLAGSMQHNRLGAVKIDHAPGLIRYHAYFNPQLTHVEQPPSEDDLQLPHAEQALFVQSAQQLGLNTQTPTQALHTVRTYFNQQFSYSLEQPVVTSSALRDFLLTRHSGHCEYFATSAALLLRAAGIPTRYAAGYLVEEYSNLENTFIVRQRHAHAWTLVYIDGYWQTLDTTPANWVNYEAERAAWWQQGYDISAWLMYQFNRWRWQENSDNSWLIWLVIPLLVLLVWRLLQRERVTRKSPITLDNSTIVSRVGDDSAFFQIIEKLEKADYQRQAGEPLEAWLQRIASDLPQFTRLQQMLAWHQRYRFDPQGLPAKEQQQLQMAVATWLQDWREKRAAKTDHT